MVFIQVRVSSGGPTGSSCATTVLREKSNAPQMIVRDLRFLFIWHPALLVEAQ